MTQKTRSGFKTDNTAAIPDGNKTTAETVRTEFGHLADSAMFPADLASGTITPFSGDVDLSGNTDGAVWTVRDGTAVLEVPAWEAGTVEIVTDASPQLGGALDLNGYTVGDASADDLTKLSAVTASAAELNYLDGTTSNVQTQLSGKAAANHTHALADISDAGTAAASDTGDFATAAQGATADTALQPATGMSVVDHGATAGTARPSGAAAVYWIGSVEPTNATDGDIWHDTSA